MFVEIYPIKRLPRRFSVFDYKIENELSTGALVEIPFRNSKIFGIVKKLKKTSDYKKLKSIHSVIDKNFLSPNELIYYEQIAKETIQAVPTILLTALPTIPKRKLELISTDKNNKPKNKGKKTFIQYKSLSEPLSIITEHLKSHPKEQTLIVVPNVHDLKVYSEELKIPFLSAALAKVKYYKTWIGFKKGEINTLVSTRQGTLIANENIDTIFVVKSSSADLKQYDQNPRYDSRDNAFLANQLFGTSIIFLNVSSTPNDLFNFTNIIKQDDLSSSKIIDLNVAKRSWDFPLLSLELIEASKKVLDNNGKILFFYNKKGVANQLYCPECKFIAKCPTCDKNLHVLESTLACKKCEKHFNHPAMCPKCGNAILKTKGLGNKNIQKTLSQIFNKKIINVIDKDNQPENAEQADILLVTQYYLQNIHHPKSSPKFDLIAMLNTSPGFITTEPFSETDTMILIRTLGAITNKSESFFIQTWEKDKINKIINNNDLYLDELQNQLKTHFLPPYSKLIRIHFKSTNLTEQQQKLDNVIRNIDSDIIVVGPYLSHDRKKMFIQLRVSLLTNDEIFGKLKDLDDNYIIDTNPIHLI